MPTAISITNIPSAVKRHLSIIGKRLYTKDGHNLFADITLSSAEDSQIINQYIHASVHDLEAAMKPLVTATSINETTATNPTVSITVTNTRGDSDFQTRVQDMATSYITLNVVGEYLSMVHPDIAQKYQRDAVQRLQALIAYVFYKKPPTAESTSYLDTDSEVVTESSEAGDNTEENNQGLEDDTLTNNTNESVSAP